LRCPLFSLHLFVVVSAPPLLLLLQDFNARRGEFALVSFRVVPPLQVLDFEATCQDGPQKISPQEIIEVPVVLLNMTTLKVMWERGVVRARSSGT
jgi:hypothetical protein